MNKSSSVCKLNIEEKMEERLMRSFGMENSNDFVAEVEMWCKKLNNLMRSELQAAVAVVAYYLPHQCTMVGCPLGDREYQELGETMRTNPALFAAAERTGLFAEGIHDFCYAALDNAGSWNYYADDIEYLLKNDELCKYISFPNRYLAECLIAGGVMLREEENEDLWLRYVRVAQKKLDERARRGYAY